MRCSPGAALAMRLLIRGTPKQARAAAAHHRIAITACECLASTGDTILTAPAVYVGNAVRWLREPATYNPTDPKRGWPRGTLVRYTRADLDD